MRFARRAGAERVVPLELAPMIDVVFLLIIFFMTTARFAQETRAEVELPRERGEQEKASEEAGLIVNVDAAGAIIVARGEITLEELEAMIEDEAAGLRGRDPAGVRLLLRVDRRADTGRLNEILSRLERRGVATARLATEVP